MIPRALGKELTTTIFPVVNILQGVSPKLLDPAWKGIAEEKLQRKALFLPVSGLKEKARDTLAVRLFSWIPFIVLNLPWCRMFQYEATVFWE